MVTLIVKSTVSYTSSIVPGESLDVRGVYLIPKRLLDQVTGPPDDRFLVTLPQKLGEIIPYLLPNADNGKLTKTFQEKLLAL